jgi:type I restriction enzyme, S subunit
MSWTERAFIDVFRFRNGKAIKPGSLGAFPAYGSNGLIGCSTDWMYENAIIIGRVGAYCPGHFWASDNTIVVEPDPNQMDVRFSFYFLKNAGLNRHAGGAAQPLLTQGALKPLMESFPPLPIQRRIAGILSAYDDLIENNTRRIAILEDMARRLFEEWFVRFRFPGGNGQMPEDWVEAQLGDVVSINPESISPKRASDQIGYIDIASVSPGRVDQIQQMDFTEAPGRARRIVREGDVIWSNVRPNRRSFALLLNVPEHTVASTGFTVLRATDVPWSYLLMLTSTSDFVTYLVNRAKGSAYPAVGCSDFAEAEILMPSSSLLERYHSVVGPMLQNVSSLEQQSASARAARDLLLPKLISGEIDVSRAEADGLPDHAPELLAAAE